MTQQQYQTLIQTYGVSPSRWPQHCRADAASFARAHPKQAVAIDAQERFIDQVLDKAQHASADNALLIARILKTAAGTPQRGVAANDDAISPLARAALPALSSRWKTLAAVLLVMTTTGFALGQASALSGYNTAEALLALNVDTSNNWSEILP